MTQRRHLAIGLLLVFVTGTLLVPAVHKWDLSCAGDGAETEVACHACCSGDQTDEHDQPDGARHTHPNRKPHDPSTCSICQLAKLPVNAPLVTVALPQDEAVELTVAVASRQPDFATPRLLPFSCGPPA